MSDFGGYNAGQGTIGDGLALIPSWDEFFNALMARERANNERLHAIETWIAGPVGQASSGALEAAVLVAEQHAQSDGPIGVYTGVSLAVIQLLASTHGLSNLDTWLANAIDPRILDDANKPTGLLPQLTADMAAGAAVGAMTLANTTNILNGGIQVSSDLESADIAQAVWSYIVLKLDPPWEDHALSASQVMMSLYDFIDTQVRNNGVSVPENPQFTAFSEEAWEITQQAVKTGHIAGLPNLPHIAPVTGRAAGDLLSVLAAAVPSLLWTLEGPDTFNTGGGYPWAEITEPVNYWLRFNTPVTDWQPATAAAVGGPVVYPGADKIQVVHSRNFSDSVGVVQAMHGCSVRIENVAPKQGRYIEPQSVRYPYLGWLVFISDTGEADELQRVEYGRGVYVPKRMAAAAGLDLFVKSGTTGNLQCWVVA